MKIFPTTKLMLKWDIVATVDLSTATARVEIDGEWHNLTWLSLSLPQGDNFMRTAALEVGGALSDAAVKLTYRQEPLIEVTVGTEKIVASSNMVQVL